MLNAGPKPLHLRRGQKLFLIWYADLDGPTEKEKKVQGFDGIDPELLNGISGEILSLQSLSDEQRSLERRISRLSTFVWVLLAISIPLIGRLLWDLLNRASPYIS